MKINLYETEMNYKGKLIEFCKKLNLPEPKYFTKIKRDLFISKITLNGIKKNHSGKGKTKKDAEKKVSKKTLEELIKRFNSQL